MWRFYKAIRPLPGFNVDEPTGTLPYSAELFATVHDTGRFLEDVRCQLQAEEGGGGCEHRRLDHPDPEVPRDVELRKGLLSSLWVDIPALVSGRDAQVLDDQGAGILA